jgi:hypothetical protein
MYIPFHATNEDVMALRDTGEASVANFSKLIVSAADEIYNK